jgi:hypothetical protein
MPMTASHRLSLATGTSAGPKSYMVEGTLLSRDIRPYVASNERDRVS